MIKTPPFCKKTDWLIVGILLVTALVLTFLFTFSDGATAVIRVNGTPTHTLSLSENREITLENKGIRLIVCVENHAVSVRESTCPDGICRRTGTIDKAGQTIVCLPAACTVTIKGPSPQVDGLTY